MKYFYFLLFLLTVSFANAQVGNYTVGDTVDDFTVTDTEGTEHTLYDYTAAGKYVFIDFSFVTCGPCQAVAPIFNEFYDKYGCGTGDIMCFSMFGIYGNDNSDVENFEASYGGSFNHAPGISIDGGATAVDSDYGIPAYPTTCIIAPDNTIISLDIWPISGVSSYEDKFPDGFNPEPMECTVGIDDLEEISFSIYPNPSNGSSFSINLVNEAEANVTILNLLGKKIYTTPISLGNNEISTDLAQGTYFVQIKTNTGLSVRKLLVE